MKRFFPILLALLALTACPQAGQILGPANSTATASSDGSGDSSSSSSSSSSAATPPDASPPSEATSPPDQREGYIATNRPIEPKSDIPTVGGESADYVRLRYGDNFATLLDPKAEVFDTIPVGVTGEIHLPAVAESRRSTNFPWKGSEGSFVRMVFLPTDTSATPQYCDASVLGDATQEGGNVLFSGVSATVMGSLNFLHLNPNNIVLQKTQVNQSSDPISLCSLGWKPWNNENPLNSNWLYVGSMDSPVKFRIMTTPHATQQPSQPLQMP